MKKLLFSLMLGLVFVPGLTLAQADPGQSGVPVPGLYNEPAENEEAIPMLISESKKAVPALINEETPVPELINAAPVLYVDPVSAAAHQINNAYDAFRIMQKYALGVNQKDYDRFNREVPGDLDGRILLNVEDKGKAYIVDYKNNKLIYLGRPDNALKVFREYKRQVITGKDWTWVKTTMNDGKVLVPKEKNDFTINFKDSGQFVGATDCNSIFGDYREDGNKLSLGPIGSTRMYCKDSQELEFTGSLAEVDSFLFDKQGNLVLILKLDSGSMTFTKNAPVDLKQGCEERGGAWLPDYRECEYADKEWCGQAGGVYKECGSACRHNPDPLAPCTLQCVMVCEFAEEDIAPGNDPQNSTYIIEEEQYTLVDGKAEKEVVPGSASRDVVKIFEANTTGDMNGDGVADTAVVLTRDSGGSGTFYYIALAVKEGGRYKGSNAVLLGDRIAPQTTEIGNDELIVNYAIRAEGESFAAQPSIGVSKYLVYKDGLLTEK